MLYYIVIYNNKNASILIYQNTHSTFISGITLYIILCYLN